MPKITDRQHNWFTSQDTVHGPPGSRDAVSTGPRRGWTGKEPAGLLQVKPHTMLTQLAEWTRPGFLTRTSAGTYALATPP